VDVGDANVEEAAHPVRVGGRFQGDRRLVVCGATADVDDDPAVRERDDRRLSLHDGLAAEHVGIEAARALDVVGDDEVRERDSLLRCWELRHRDLHRGCFGRVIVAARPAAVSG
jgi:hypothetical protein